MDMLSAAVVADTQDWNEETKVTMLAIAKAESALIEAAEGDSLSNYRGYWHQLYAPFACNGKLAFGLWQVFTYWHAQKLTKFTGSTDPCVWATWLKDPVNNATAANEILQSQGFEAWSAFKSNTHEQFLAEARQAIKDLHWTEGAPFDQTPRDKLLPIPSLLRHLAAEIENAIAKAFPLP